MANKRKHRFDLRRLDRNNPVYWEELLRREGLTHDAGRSNHIVYVEDITAVSDAVDSNDGKVGEP